LIDEHRIANAYIEALQHASLDDENLPPDVLERLRSPRAPPRIDDPDIILSLRLYLSSPSISVDAYNAVCEAVRLRHPEDNLLSFDEVKKTLTEVTGVVSLPADMCVRSCHAYTGPIFAPLTKCYYCGEPRYDPLVLEATGGKVKRPRQVFHTMPLGPQLQAQRGTPSGAEDMLYLQETTKGIFVELAHKHKIEIYRDTLYGNKHIEAVKNGEIGEDDPVLVLSVDGAQLYRDKKSDCWIYIWILLNLSPHKRYKKRYILPGGTIPGKPKNFDSYLYVGLHHLSALQREGLPMWDALKKRVIDTNPYLALGTADGPGLAMLDGTVGHMGALGCRVHCAVGGRHRPGAPSHYPAHLKPHNYNVAGCDHESIDVSQPLPPRSLEEYESQLAFVLASENQTQFELRRKQTGIAKPTIFSGIRHRAKITDLFPLDIMHALNLNLPELHHKLMRGMLDCIAPDSKRAWSWAVFADNRLWEAHGQAVADARPYFPGSFDRPPRNPAQKINSGYKAIEYQNYMYGLGPGLFYSVLPEEYWINFCKLVRVARIMFQHEIPFEQVQIARQSAVEYVQGYETLYYQQKVSRIHFCRQSVHNILHLAPETFRGGPLPYTSQYPMERTIGSLGQEIRQPSNPFANLSQRAVVRCQVNALKALVLDLTRGEPEARIAIDLGGGYTALHPRDRSGQKIAGPEGLAICEALQGDMDSYTHVRLVRWARVRLPNGQIARCAWKEKQRPLENVRMARNIKLKLNGKLAFAEVQFFFPAPSNYQGGGMLALVSMYPPHDPALFAKSQRTLRACTHPGADSLRVISVRDILSVVAMVPMPR
ncbi:hypothetical protein BOTBODRAFT_82929, partial [Botryobasidium botryosum FD-172 SS1]